MQRKSVTVSAIAAQPHSDREHATDNYNNSHGHTHVIYVQVSVLNRELATLQEEMPYLAAIWHPMPVVQFWGRSAPRQPPCAKEHAVFHWWRVCEYINKWNLLAHRIHKHDRWSLSPTIYSCTL